MERKTIGKFISALRHANGMTQKELAERLFVSDKTVSRWERDESSPEITLIPVIAELFGVTSDELIRGERMSAEKDNVPQRVAIKTEKSIRAIIYEKNKRRGNFLLISLGITFLGVIAAMIANLGFSKGLIGFCLATAFAFAGEIVGICFFRNTMMLLEGGDFSCGTEEIEEYNRRVIMDILKLSFFNICVIAFCIPIVAMTSGGANYGLSFGSWILYGTLCVAIALVILYIIRIIWIDNELIRRGIVYVTESERNVSKAIRNKLMRTVVVFLTVELVLVGGMWFNYQFLYDIVVEKKVFSTCDEFKAFVEKDVAEWRRLSAEENTRIRAEIENNVHIGVEEIGGGEYNPIETGRIYDSDGNLICEYEYIPYFYKSVRFTASSEDKTPITVVTYQAGHDAASVVDTVGGVLIVGMAANFALSVVYYAVSVIKIRKVLR